MVSDSQAAILAITNPPNKQGQGIAHCTTGAPDSGNAGNEALDQSAKKAAIRVSTLQKDRTQEDWRSAG